MIINLSTCCRVVTTVYGSIPFHRCFLFKIYSGAQCAELDCSVWSATCATNKERILFIPISTSSQLFAFQFLFWRFFFVISVTAVWLCRCRSLIQNLFCSLMFALFRYLFTRCQAIVSSVEHQQKLIMINTFYSVHIIIFHVELCVSLVFLLKIYTSLQDFCFFCFNRVQTKIFILLILYGHLNLDLPDDRPYA